MTLFPYVNPLVAIFNVKTGYGAAGDGVADDTQAIKNAITACGAAGGGVVYFPVGNYKITSNIELTSLVTASMAISLIGERNPSNSSVARITANFGDFMFSQSKVPNAFQVLHYMGGLFLSNSHASGGCLKLEGCNGTIIEQCSFSAALMAVRCYFDSFCTIFRSCNVTGTPGNQGVGMALGQGAIENCSFSGWGGTALRIGNVGVTVTGSRFEVNQISIDTGTDPDGNNVGMTGFSIIGNSFEQGDNHIRLFSCGGGIISGNYISGNTIGPGHPISSASWSGGVVTANVLSPNTLDAFGWTATNRQVQIALCTPSGYNSGGAVTGTRLSSTQFQYPLAVDPGSSFVSGNWSLYPQYGIKCVSPGNCIISGNGVAGAYEQFAIDASGASGCIFSANTPGGLTAITNSWNVPSSGPLALNPGAATNTLDFTNKNLDHSKLITNITGATYTIGGGIPSGGEWPTITCNRGTGQTITIAQDGTAALTYPVDWEFEITQLGTGQVTFAAGTGVTLNSLSGNLKISGQYGVVLLKKVAANTWVLSGNLSP